VTLIKEQVKMENFKTVLMVGLVSLGLSFDASAATSVNEAYGQCKAEVREKFGSDTRIKMKGAKSTKGRSPLNYRWYPMVRHASACCVKSQTVHLF
jgi:hypothetical protein